VQIGLQKLRAYSEVLLMSRFEDATTSPEQLSGKSAIPASDVYAFGIVLWEIYTREEPYPPGTYETLRKSVLNRRARPKLPRDTHPALANASCTYILDSFL